MTRSIRQAIEIFALILIILLVNLRSFTVWGLFPDTARFTGQAWREIFLWFFLLVLLIYLMKEQGIVRSYFPILVKQPILVIFITYALLSAFWAVSLTGTLFRSLELLFASLTAIYLYKRYTLEEFLNIIFWVGIAFLLASLLLAYFSPKIGTDLNPPYDGAWRGIFWHKNHLGNIVPLYNLIFLIKIFQRDFNNKYTQKILAIVFYFLSLFVIYMTRSASGYIVVILLHSTFLGVTLWLKNYYRLKSVHYWAVLIILLAGIVIVLSNLDTVFGLFGRETTLTGRVPLWTYLFEEVYLKKPLFGYGFGSIWTLESFRLSVKNYLGWGYPVMMGDNGFLDILINGGAVGLVLFLLLYAKTWIGSIRFSITRRTMIGFVPVFILLFTLFANLSFSLFFETELLTWTLCTCLLFFLSPNT